jgi:hypothetical protein
LRNGGKSLIAGDSSTPNAEVSDGSLDDCVTIAANALPLLGPEEPRLPRSPVVPVLPGADWFNGVPDAVNSEDHATVGNSEAGCVSKSFCGLEILAEQTESLDTTNPPSAMPETDSQATARTKSERPALTSANRGILIISRCVAAIYERFKQAVRAERIIR